MAPTRTLAGAAVLALALAGCGDDTTDNPGTDAGPAGSTTDSGTPVGGSVFDARDFNCTPGAAPPCATTEPARSEAQRTAAVADGDMSATFVLSSLGFPPVDLTNNQAAGFNLDAIDSGPDGAFEGTCEEVREDYASFRDSGHVGVDNAFAQLVGFLDGFIAGEVNDPNDEDGTVNDCVDAMGELTTDGCLEQTVNRQISEGDLLVMFTVSGWNGTPNDDAVMVQLFLGELPVGTTPMTDASGALTGGQTFTTGATLGAPQPADVFNGRLRVRTPSLPLSFPFGMDSVSINVGQAELRVDITSTGAPNGAIGGVFTRQEVIDVATDLVGELASQITPLLDGVADVRPSSADDTVCEAVSVGIHFEAVTAIAN